MAAKVALLLATSVLLLVVSLAMPTIRAHRVKSGLKERR